jgi:hypothetical protein
MKDETADSSVLPNERLSRIVWYGGLIIVSVSLLNSIGTGALRETFFGSDDLYLPALYEDLARWSGRISDWRLTPAPYFFPDMLLYGTMRALTGSIEWAQYLSGWLHLGLFVGAAALLAWAVGPEPRRFGWFFAPAVVGLFWLNRFGRLPMFGGLFHLTHHGGSALMTLAVLPACLAPRSKARGWAVLLFCVGMVSGLSDPLFAASCGAPLLLLALLALFGPAWRIVFDTPERVRRTVRGRAAACAIGSFAGAWSTRLLHEHMNGLDATGSKKAPLELVATVIHDLLGPALPDGVWLIAGLVAAAWVLCQPMRSCTAALRQLACFVIVSIASTIAAIAVDGGYLDPGSIRYLMVSDLLAIVLVYVVIEREVRLRFHPIVQRRLLWFAASATIVGLVLLVTVSVSQLARAQFHSDWRDTARCVADISQREGVDTVLADYWLAKPIMLFSDRGVLALQVRAKLRRPYFWINSRAWYRAATTFGVVIFNDLRPETIMKTFGPPAALDRCGQLEVASYRGEARARLTANMSKQFRHFAGD